HERLCRRQIRLRFRSELRAQMVDIEQQQRLRIVGLEALKRARLPALGQKFGGVHVLFEEALLVRNLQKIEHRDNHVHVGNQNRLREVGGEFAILLFEALPESRERGAQIFGVQLRHMRANLETLVKLIGSELADRNTANELPQTVFSELQ